MLLLGLLFVLRRARRDDARPAAETARGLRPLSIVTAALVLATIVAGGYVAGTEYHGTPDQPLVGAHSACGTGWSTDQFPGCNGQGPLSFGQSRLADIQLAHRLFMYLTAISVLAMAALALRRRAPSRAFWIAAADPGRPDRARRDQRLGGQARGPDRRPPGARHDPLGDRRLRGRDPDAGVGPGPGAGLRGRPAVRRCRPDGERDHHRPRR